MMKRFLIIISALFTLFLISACGLGFNVLRGSGDVISEERAVESFDSIKVEGAGEIILTQSDEVSLRVEAEDNILPEIVTEVNDGELLLTFKDDSWRNSVVPTESIRFYISFSELNEITIAGAAKISADGLRTTDLKLRTDGAADVNFKDIQADSLTVDLNGGAQFELSGKVTEQTILIDGAGSYNAGDLESEETYVSIAGAAETVLWVNQNLDIDLAGAGSVRYYGDPHVTQDIDGVSTVRSLGDH